MTDKDIQAVMKTYKLPKAFPTEVLAEAASLDSGKGSRSVTTDLAGRLDLRKKFIFTCDPVTAKDYDDALSFEKGPKGTRVLGVHIADVSHYVKPGSAIDKEAYRRSTSVYFPGKVIPMLPEALSNGLCSLVPNEDRLAFSVFMTFDQEGEMVKRSFAKSVIRSQARFTYEQVMGIIKGNRPDEKIKSRQVKLIQEINRLAQQLRAKRFAAGALDLEIPEPEVMLDAAGDMQGIELRPYDESHQMIEECMVAANEAVAKELWTKGVKILARLHEPPEPDRVEMLRADLRALGIRVGNITNPRVFAQFLQTIKKHPLYETISVMILRSMKKAVYDSVSMGHFGLAKKYYAHFTSPIRRYPDLTLHRQLADYIAKREAKRPPNLLAKWAEHTSFAEERAAEAEREVLEMKKYRLLEDELAARMPVEYEAVVSKCMPFGCFVEIPSIMVSGLIHVNHLSRRFVKFNEYDHSLSAPGGGKWRIGDRIKVRCVKVDFANRRIDFIPVRTEGVRRTRKTNHYKDRFL